MNQLKQPKFWLGAGLGTMLGWTMAQQFWAVWQVGRRNVHHTLATQTNEAPPGLTFDRTEETDAYTVRHTVEDGIERISYLPATRRFETPLLMQHGMWHGAWCWQPWQALLAEWGWESHAVSLPGHAGSPEQRPIKRCTLDYYLSFLKTEVARLPQPPVLLGHSMGGALTQWYLKYVGDLPAAVLVASWTSHAMLVDGWWLIWRLDPIGCLLTSLRWEAAFVRSPRRAGRALLATDGLYTPEELHARLGPESALVLYQHNPPFWSPPAPVKTPLLWLAGERDAVIAEAAAWRSAAFYGADYVVVDRAGHNLMMEASYRQTAALIHDWLASQVTGGR